MATQLTIATMTRTLDWAYDKAVSGLGVMDSAEELAADYSRGHGSLHEQVNTLIKWQSTKAATSGFVNGMAGVLAMPITVPANIASVMYVQIRMIAAIAHMGGYNLQDDRVRTLVYACLCGNAAKDVVKELGIQLGTRLTEQAVKKISMEALGRINEAVGFKLLSQVGSSSAMSVSKLVPLIGGVIGGAMDSMATKTIGNIARDTFITDKKIPPQTDVGVDVEPDNQVN